MRRTVLGAAFCAMSLSCNDQGPHVEWATMSSQGSSVCAISSGGRGYCQGDDAYGQLGNGTSAGSTDAFGPIDAAIRLSEIYVGLGHVCALNLEGAAYCWGVNGSGQLGDNTLFARPSPWPVESELRFNSLAVGGSHTCGIAMGGATYCWGRNLQGELGDSTAEWFRKTPTRVAGGRVFTQLSIQQLEVRGQPTRFTCGLAADGVYCWGGFNDQESQAVRAAYRSVPIFVAGTSTITQLGSGNCGLSSQGEVFCWDLVRKSDGTATWTEAFRKSGDMSFASVSRHGHVALTNAGVAYAIEPVAIGQTPPILVAGAENLRFAMFDGLCGLTLDGEVFCRENDAASSFVLRRRP